MEGRLSNYLMEVIPEPQEGTASVLQFDKKGQFAIIKGSGTDNYLCGACQNEICQGVVRGQIIRIVFRCPNCDSYNLIRGT